MIIIGGSYEGKLFDDKQVKFLASLQSLDEVRGMIIGLLQAPGSKIASILKEPGNKVARSLNAFANKGN